MGTELLNNLEEENFQEIEVGNPLAVEIVDDQTENSVYYFFKGYENDMDEIVVAMFIYEPTSDSLLVTSAEKVDAESWEKISRHVAKMPDAVCEQL